MNLTMKSSSMATTNWNYSQTSFFPNFNYREYEQKIDESDKEPLQASMVPDRKAFINDK